MVKLEVLLYEDVYEKLLDIRRTAQVGLTAGEYAALMLEHAVEDAWRSGECWRSRSGNQKPENRQAETG